MADRPTPSALLRSVATRWWRRAQDEPRRPLALTTAAVLAAGLIALDGGIEEPRDDGDGTGGLATVTYVEESATGCADDVTRWLQSPDMDAVMYEVGTTSPKFRAFMRVNAVFQANAMQYGVDRASEIASTDIAEQCLAAYPTYSAPVSTPIATQTPTTYYETPTDDGLDPAEQAEILAGLQGPQAPDLADCETAGQELTAHLPNVEAYPLLREHGCGFWLDSWAG